MSKRRQTEIDRLRKLAEKLRDRAGIYRTAKAQTYLGRAQDANLRADDGTAARWVDAAYQLLDAIRNGRDTGLRILDARMASGQTQEIVAEAAGISQGHLADIEAGRYEPKLLTLRWLAKALNLKLEDLL